MKDAPTTSNESPKIQVDFAMLVNLFHQADDAGTFDKWAEVAIRWAEAANDEINSLREKLAATANLAKEAMELFNRSHRYDGPPRGYDVAERLQAVSGLIQDSQN